MKNKNYFKGKVVVVTGGGSGLGQSLCFKLAGYEAIVICTDKDIKSAENTIKLIKIHNKKSTAYQLDVSDNKQVVSVMANISSAFGTIDFLFNNAGITIGGEIRDLDILHWKKVIDVNLLGLISCSTEAFRLMSKNQKGHIINVTSISALLDYTAISTPYAVSKHGALTFSKALRLEALDFNIKVTTVCPGAIKTTIGENMEHVNANDNSRQKAIDFIEKGISAELAAQKILNGIIGNKKVIIFPNSFKFYYQLTRIFRFIDKNITLKLIRDFRKNDRLN